MKLNAKAFGIAGAALSALCMILAGILGNLGIYTGAAEQMAEWQMFFNLSIGGIIAGAIEAAIIGGVAAYVFALIYNKIAKA